jgi:hypothetical protein
MDDIIELNGRNYTVTTEYDDCMGAPWDEHDGHGIVSDWVTRDKYAGEWILSEDRHSKRFYDYAGTMKKAKAEGWGLGPGRIAALTAKLGRAPTKGEITAEAVRFDFEYLQGWANDEWHWAYVKVTGPDGEYDTCGGFSDEDDDGIMECAQDLAAQLDSAWQDKQTEEATL